MLSQNSADDNADLVIVQASACIQAACIYLFMFAQALRYTERNAIVITQADIARQTVLCQHPECGCCLLALRGTGALQRLRRIT
jgi:hypothetical protein